MRFALRTRLSIPASFRTSHTFEPIQFCGCSEYLFVTLDQQVQIAASGEAGMSFLRGQNGVVGLTPVGVLT